VLSEILLGEVRERHARASLASLRRGERALERFSGVVGAGVPAALNPSRTTSVEAEPVGPDALPAGSSGLELEDLPVLHGCLHPFSVTMVDRLVAKPAHTAGTI
jgi:hypothetical protein